MTRVGRIVTDLLSFSRRAIPRRTDADLNGLVRETAALIEHKLQLANVRLVLELDDTMPRFPCDPTSLQQVLINLVMYGSEAISGGGTVTVRTRTEPDGGVRMEVSDTGVGIPEPLRERIFDPFFTTKEPGRGVGLGLSVVHGIVDGHGGTIHVASAVGRGTRFTVLLPPQPAETRMKNEG